MTRNQHRTLHLNLFIITHQITHLIAETVLAVCRPKNQTGPLPQEHEEAEVVVGDQGSNRGASAASRCRLRLAFATATCSPPPGTQLFLQVFQ